METPVPGPQESAAPPTVVIVAYRSARDLPACLAALRRTRGGPPPLVVVENGCPEGSARMVTGTYPEAVVLRLPRNLGFAEGANAGIWTALGKGPRDIVLLNPDTAPEPEWLQALIDAARANPAAGIMGSLILSGDGASIEESQVLALRTAGMAKDESSSPDPGAPREMRSIIGASMLIRSPVLQCLGGFDPAFFMYGEEQDYCIRARARGFRVLLVPASRVAHRTRGSSRGLPGRLRVRWYLARNDGLILLKRPHLSLRTGVLDLPFRVGRLVCRDLASFRPVDALLRLLSLPVLLAMLPRVARTRREESAGAAHLHPPSAPRGIPQGPVVTALPKGKPGA